MSATIIKACWNGTLIAESQRTVVVDGNHYFPAADIKSEYFHPSEHTSICFWKGMANYHHIMVDGALNENAAWYYASPKGAAENIRGHIAFWKGVEVTSE